MNGQYKYKYRYPIFNTCLMKFMTMNCGTRFLVHSLLLVLVVTIGMRKKTLSSETVLAFIVERNGVQKPKITLSNTLGSNRIMENKNLIQKETIHQKRKQNSYLYRYLLLYSSQTRISLHENAASIERDNDQSDTTNFDDTIDDESLLKLVTKQKLQSLCQLLKLSTSGSKVVLLGRLRSYAASQRQMEWERYKKRLERIEEYKVSGDSSNNKERYEIIDDDDSSNGFFVESTDGNALDDIIFTYPEEALIRSLCMEGNVSASTTNATSNDTPTTTSSTASSSDLLQNITKNNSKKVYTNAYVTAPPPPPLSETTENGERVVTVYNSAEQNDLTGIAASQPGANSGVVYDSTAMTSGGSGSGSQHIQPWDQQSIQKQALKGVVAMTIEKAKEQLTGLVQTLLSMTGLPAFELVDDVENVMDTIKDDDDDDDDDNMNDEDNSVGVSYSNYKIGKNYIVTNNNKNKIKNGQQSSSTFVGFQPENVPIDLLTSCSQALLLRNENSNVDFLDELLRYYEIQAIGYDGLKGDDVTKGGGHYVQVQKVRSFLEGYRSALRRKLARSTVVLMLEKLMQEGVAGLDLLLSSMSISSDSATTNSKLFDGVANDEPEPQLNQALFEFLNDAIRQQEKKVERCASSISTNDQTSNNIIDNNRNESINDELINELWNVTTDEDGYRVESIDPTDPNVKRLLQEEFSNNSNRHNNDGNTIDSSSSVRIPQTGPEQLLLLLKLLRERIKVEATYGTHQNGEKSTNLRLLAYCLRSETLMQREQLILQQVGYSSDRLDSFIELVTSSIEYGESTSYELQPGQSGSKLNLPLLRSILDQAVKLRQQRSLSKGTFSSSSNDPLTDSNMFNRLRP